MAKYKPYDKYTDSEIPWLGKMPIHWMQTFIKGITKTYSEKGKPDLELLSVYRDYGVIKKASRDDNHNNPGMDLSGNKVVYPNTLVLNKMKTWSGSLGVSNYYGIVSPAYITCNIDLEKVETKYLNYLLRCKNYVFEYKRLSYGVRPSQWDMRYQDFKSIPVFLPPKNEQSAIASFLDFKLAKISRFIKKKKQILDLYTERRKSLTRQLVNSKSVKFLRLSSVASLIQRPIERLDNNLYIPVGLYNRGRGIFHKEPTLGKDLGDSVFFKIKEGDVILSGQFAWEGSVALAGIEDEECIASHRYPILNCDKNVIIPEYLFSFFTIPEGHNLLDYNSRGAAGRNRPLNPRNLIKEKIPVPEISLQLELIELIRRERELKSIINNEIALVEEFKTALIVEAVTGKIDLRDYEFTTIEEVETYENLEEELDIAAEEDVEYKNQELE